MLKGVVSMLGRCEVGGEAAAVRLQPRSVPRPRTLLFSALA
jgi:hypothetical protein